jgi:hypothetical protein
MYNAQTYFAHPNLDNTHLVTMKVWLWVVVMVGWQRQPSRCTHQVFSIISAVVPKRVCCRGEEEKSKRGMRRGSRMGERERKGNSRNHEKGREEEGERSYNG